MNEQEALWRVAGVIVVIAIWGYCNFSMDPVIVKDKKYQYCQLMGVVNNLLFI